MLHIDTSEELCLQDFIKWKSYFPFSKWRSVAKTINFSLIFGCTAMSFANTLEIEAGWPEAEADEFINNKPDGQKMLQATIAKKAGMLSPKRCKYLVAATYMRNSFFDTYKGLGYRIEREQQFAKEHGYVRTWHGPVRHMPELNYMKFSEKGLMGADKELYGELYAHLLNEACNSTVQSLEARVAFATWYSGAQYLKAWSLKSKIWNNIHDSLDYWVYKPELQLVLALANETASWERDPVEGIHMSFDGEISDVQDMEHRDNTYWKHGKGMDILPIEEALTKWNEKHSDNPLIYIGCDWWWDRLDPDRPKWYNHFVELHGKEKVDKMIELLEGIPFGKGKYDNPAPSKRRIIAA